MTIAAIGLGLLIGAILGGLGGGGAILTVPALVYLLGQDVQDATTSSLVIVGLASLTGLLSHARSGRVQWRLGIMFGIAGAAAALGGSALSRNANSDILLLCFSVVMVASSIALFSRSRRPVAEPEPSGTGGVAVLQRTRVRTVVKILVAGLGVGFLTGFFGVGGGFVIVPALTQFSDARMRSIVPTSLMVIALVSAFTVMSAAAHGLVLTAIEWAFVGAAIAGMAGGRVFASHVPQAALQRAFAAICVVVAGVLVWRVWG
jgi:uncharacterized protein